MSYIKDFCLKYEYPLDAVEELENAYKKLEGSEAFSEFQECIAAYEADYNFDEKTDFRENCGNVGKGGYSSIYDSAFIFNKSYAAP